MVKFMSNRIGLGNEGQTFNDYVQKVAAADQSMTKQASKEEKDEAESSGQPEAEGKLVNNPKVEDDQKKEAKAKTDDIKEDVKEDEKDDQKKEAGVKGVCKKCNKPNFLCKCDASDGDSDDKDDKKDDADCDCDDDDKKDCKDCSAEEDTETKEASGKNEDECADSSGQLDVEPLHQKGESEKPSAIDAKNKKTEASQKKHVKIAKLNSETRKFLQSYWSTIYPPEYVEAMLAEK